MEKDVNSNTENHPLNGEELVQKVESLNGEECWSLQERVYECGHSSSGDPDYAGYLKAFGEAKETESD